MESFPAIIALFKEKYMEEDCKGKKGNHFNHFNMDMDYIIKIIKLLVNLRILIHDVSEIVKHEIIRQ